MVSLNNNCIMPDKFLYVWPVVLTVALLFCNNTTIGILTDISAISLLANSRHIGQIAANQALLRAKSTAVFVPDRMCTHLLILLLLLMALSRATVDQVAQGWMALAVAFAAFAHLHDWHWRVLLRHRTIRLLYLSNAGWAGGYLLLAIFALSGCLFTFEKSIAIYVVCYASLLAIIGRKGRIG